MVMFQKPTVKKLLLTRAKENNIACKRYLSGKYQFLECSLISYKKVNFDYTTINNYPHIIVTSNYGARLLPKRNLLAGNINKFAWVVGESAAAILQDKDYIVCYTARNVDDLIEHLPQPIYSKMVYLSANHITMELPAEIKRVVHYLVSYRKNLTPAQISFYKEGIDYILLYSKNCAYSLINLLLKYNLLQYIENTTVIVISLKVEEVIRKFFKNIVVSKNAAQMLEYLVYEQKN